MKYTKRKNTGLGWLTLAPIGVAIIFFIIEKLW